MDATIQVCDIKPVVGEATKRFELTISDGREVKLDLCVDHAEPIEVLIEKALGASAQEPAKAVTRLQNQTRTPVKKAAAAATSDKPPINGRRASRTVKSMDEVEAARR